MNTRRQQDSSHLSEWWARRPRRSRTDSKVAGVAGGIGWYLGIDPLLIRVGFVALTVLGGAGVLIYCLLWLLLPAEGDDVSAAEALLGRGQSSMSPVLAVGLTIAVAVSVLSSLSWGKPFWPGLIFVLVFGKLLYRRHGRAARRPGGGCSRSGTRPESAGSGADDSADPAGNGGGARYGPPQWGGPPWGRSASSWGRHPSGGSPWGGSGSGGSGWGGSGWGGSGWGSPSHSGSSETGSWPVDLGPHPRTANWTGGRQQQSTGAYTGNSAGEQAAGPDAAWFVPTAGPAAAGAAGGDTDPTDADPAGTHSEPTGADSRPQPPSWDPLGAAPFAWDLPDIDLTTDPTTDGPSVRVSVIGRIAAGAAMLTAAAQILGMVAGWWTLGWAAIAGSALAVVGLGLLIQALLGRRLTLIGAGAVLSVATIGLALTGLTGIASVGDRTWSPGSGADIQAEYRLGTGSAVLDLSSVELRRGETVHSTLEVNVGSATVTLPPDTNVDVTCRSNAGQIDCVGELLDGLDSERTFTDHGHPEAGLLTLDVHVGTGEATVTR